MEEEKSVVEEKEPTAEGEEEEMEEESKVEEEPAEEEEPVEENGVVACVASKTYVVSPCVSKKGTVTRRRTAAVAVATPQQRTPAIRTCAGPAIAISTLLFTTGAMKTSLLNHHVCIDEWEKYPFPVKISHKSSLKRTRLL